MKTIGYIFAIAIMCSTQKTQAQFKGCFAIGSGTKPESYSSSGNQYIDNVTTQELLFLQSRFLVYPIFFFYDDKNGKDAYATDKVYQNNGPDGTIFFGKRLFNSEMIKSTGGTSIPIIIAHEFGHIVDFKYGVLNEPVLRRELFADYLAGAYMYIRANYFKSTDIDACIESFKDMGDTNFGKDDFHGTPEQRGDALLSGFNAMKNSFASGSPLNLNQVNKKAKEYVKGIELPVDSDASDPRKQ